MLTCDYCQYISNKSFNVKRHVARNHNNQTGQQLEFLPSFQQQSQDLDGSYDIRLKENFKLFISGPSRCGKTVFISKLIENISSFAKQPPSTIIYVYKVWQQKYDELMSLGVNFILDSDNVVDDIKSGASGQPVFVIFDDLINSPSLSSIANLFTVDARHMNISMAFLTQRMFVNDEYFRQISQNCDYFCIFKNR